MKKSYFLATFLITHFLSGLVYLLPVAFFPEIAIAKGATPFQFGFIFGVYDLAAFIFSIICGKYLSVLGVNLFCQLSLYLLSIACSMFSVVSIINSLNWFMFVSILIRIFAGIADAIYLVSSFSIILHEFPERAFTYFAIMESFYGLGLLTSPAVGLYLYATENFLTPFMTVGILVFCAGIFTSISLRLFSICSEEAVETDKNGMKLLKYPLIILYTSSLIFSTFSFTSIVTMLRYHLKTYKLTLVLTSIVYLIPGAMYSVSSIAWGHFIDKGLNSNFVGAFGGILIAFSFTLLGPTPSFAMNNHNVWLSMFLLLLLGVGIGAHSTCSFSGINKEAIRRGYPEDLKTFSLTSGMWSSCWYLGCFIGPTFSGMIIQLYGFEATVIIIAVIHYILTLLYCATLFYQRFINRTIDPNERTSLNRNN